MLKSILPLFVMDWIPAFAGMTASPIFGTELMNFYNPVDLWNKSERES
jgi:hypothetical protein